MRSLLLVALLSSAVVVPSMAQTIADPVVQHYESRGIPVEEAHHRIALSKEAAALEARLKREQPQRFAGLYIDDGAEFRVVVRLTGNDDGLLRRYTSNFAFIAEKAPQPLVAQMNKKAAMERAMAARGLEFSSDYDVQTGRFRIGAKDAASAKAAIAASAGQADDVDIVQVDQVEIPAAIIYGASNLDGTQYCDSSICVSEIATTSFAVTNGTTKGMLTAGHVGECLSSATTCVKNSGMKDQTGISLTWVAQKNAGGEDYEWRTASNTTNTFSNTIRYASTTMPVTMVGDATTYAVGTTVCKQGRTTGYTCGPIRSTASSSTYNGVTGTYIRVANSTGGAMCDSGDSGGALFVMNTALGITHAKSTTYPGECTFMPIQRISSLGLTVLTR